MAVVFGIIGVLSAVGKHPLQHLRVLYAPCGNPFFTTKDTGSAKDTQGKNVQFVPIFSINTMLPSLLCFLLGPILGLLASEFADRWGCSKRYHSPLPKKVFIFVMSGFGAAMLYWWEVGYYLTPIGDPPFFIGYFRGIPLQELFIPITFEHFPLIQRYSLLLILFTFLLAATLTDFYEMIIPDSITVIGTISALLFAILFPLSALPVTQLEWGLDGSPYTVPQVVGAMHLWSPNPIGTCSQLAMVALWWFWCFAMFDRVWYTKLPFRKAHAIFWRYLYRSPRTKYIVAAAMIVPLFFIDLYCSPESAIAVLSALTGMATGMILIWSVRLVAQWVLGVEAMGFGDVTLMGMIGAFLGWQAVLLVFFLAPFFGLVYGIFHAALGRGRAVPYGPFLCLATAVVVVFWSPIWSATAEYFAFGIGVIGAALFGLLFVFAGLLHVVHKIMSPK